MTVFFSPGAITLDMIIGGTLQAGEIPNARLETNLTALADDLTAGGLVPHNHLSAFLSTLAPLLTGGGHIPNTQLQANLESLADALGGGGIVPNSKLTTPLENLADALLAGGQVPFIKLFREQEFFQNVGNVTLLSSPTTIVTGPSIDFEQFDRILCGIQCSATKGLTTGRTRIWLEKEAGTAIPHWQNTYNQMQFDNNYHVEQTAWQCCFFGVAKVDTAGSLTLRARGDSAGSNSIISIGKCQVYLWTIERS
jgi:hypothetical protein